MQLENEVNEEKVNYIFRREILSVQQYKSTTKVLKDAVSELH